MKKVPAYKVYIDEAGDEGFKFLPGERGSSRWFVLSAAVIRHENDLQVVAAAKEVRQLLNKEPKHALHFRNLRHEQRVVYSRVVGALPIRTIHIVTHKPSIPDPENFQAHAFALYRWSARLLLERVSWLCRDMKRQADDTCVADMVFSNRAAMSYDDLRSYLGKLMGVGGNGAQGINIHWEAIDIANLRVLNHDQSAGLQIADAVASGAYYALNRNPYGEIEERYLSLTRRVLYRNRGRLKGYGMKFWCNEEAEIERVLAVCNQDP